MKVMVSDRKKSLKLPNLTNYKSLLEFIEIRFAKIKKEDLFLTYQFQHHDGEQIQFLDDEQVNQVKASNRNIKIYVCKDQKKTLKTQHSRISTSSSISTSKKLEHVNQKIESMKVVEIDSSKKQQESKCQNKVIQQKQICIFPKENEKIPLQIMNTYVHTETSCSECKAPQIVGNRWKCHTCPQYNLCDNCYKDKQLKGNHCNLSHGFHKIKNDLFYKTINYQQVISKLLNLSQQKNNQHQGQQYWISFEDFRTKGPKFQKQIENARNQLKGYFDKYMEDWQRQFIELKNQSL